MSVFIRYEESTDNKFKVIFRHFVPNELPPDVLVTGEIVDSIPEPVQQPGKNGVLYFNPTDHSLFYEYETIPPSDEERISALEDAITSLMGV